MITGIVVAGKRIGRTLNFPTANLHLEAGCAAPARGVYAARVRLDGEMHMAIMNVGDHPTLPGGGPTVEVHLLDYAGDLYGRTLAVEPVRLLRGEIKFPSKEALARQLAEDARRARALLT
ncbi:riboflavin kinase [Bacillota bacterium Meth-B3]|nr:riboflavin kinase [Christensenellaceae bacterium]MEA5066818.1 riboflavin kinase [Eubacteriales bacterium]MEA5068102.1 riboflavin kinase [Christensenellaceae bacterium]